MTRLRTARVSSPIAGRVIGAIAAVRCTVRTGDTLAVLDSPELGEAQSAYAEAMSDLNLADRDFQRIRELYDNGIAPRKEQEQAEDNLTRARSEAERARLKLANLGARPGVWITAFFCMRPFRRRSPNAISIPAWKSDPICLRRYSSFPI